MDAAQISIFETTNCSLRDLTRSVLGVPGVVLGFGFGCITSSSRWIILSFWLWLSLPGADSS
ncbi:unnamed protein product [Acidithrix sp. C25]|nr:unnamed protein product [Acidithrix sp. C25]